MEQLIVQIQGNQLRAESRADTQEDNFAGICGKYDVFFPDGMVWTLVHFDTRNGGGYAMTFKGIRFDFPDDQVMIMK